MIDVGLDWAYAFRLIVAAALGALIGLEREIHDHPAGMRTHLLVSLGSAGFTVLSIAAFPAPGADPARIAAQIVTGIGFLGAGAILKEGATIRGLTTAASLWATAAVGMAAGAGAWITAVSITVIVIVSLWPLRLVANRVIGRDPHIVRMRLLVDDAQSLSNVVAVITRHGGSVSHLATTIRKGSRLVAEVEVRAPDLASGAALTAAVAETKGIEIAESSSRDE
ncbi:MAG TPA: MgtC/SapB family protein [Candidatus Limnocylindrales bacterium]|nr:MgtC/SapB family protein [Candidatus Limnocylindrales bacterium]